ncbi:MAG: helix-turn-helix transcriptional regulator [Clostridia bacterium]|nr:helix-turn-helix transcriptional regulator [Clostridia bacterium]
MNLNEAINCRIQEIMRTNNLTVTDLCLKSNINPSTLFEFMSGKSASPKVVTIKKICAGTKITLQEFFARDYFDEISKDIN